MLATAVRSIGWSAVLLPLALAVAPLAGGAEPATPPATSTLPPPVEMTAQQDHQRLMDLLHITSLRQGADGRNPQAPNAANYDESKANPYPNLPDPLVLKNGQKVTTARMWWRRRRPEIVEDFDREIYGRAPKNTPRVKWEVNGDVPVITSSAPVSAGKLIGHGFVLGFVELEWR